MTRSRQETRRVRLAVAALCLAASLVAPEGSPALGQEARPNVATPPPAADGARPKVAAPRLPADSRTSHTLELADRTLRFTATAGALPMTNAQGRVLAEISFIAYTLDGTDARTRPVTFAFNGGPGSASTWLHLGGLGPWRVPLTPATAQPSVVPALLANEETWLGFTDLVFIDPVGTGYSRLVNDTAPLSEGPAAGNRAPARVGGGRSSNAGTGDREDGGGRWFWSIAGDVESLADFIQQWLRRADRMAAPKMLVGESYGGFRGPRIAHLLQRQRSVSLDAMILVSPVLDFESRRGRHGALDYAYRLPSYAAASLELRGTEASRTALKSVEDYARGEYLLDLLRGPRNADAVERMVGRVAETVGLRPEQVRRYSARLNARDYIREANEGTSRIASLYDASLTGFAATSAGSNFEDPFLVGLNAPLTNAMLDLYSRLAWKVERTYEMSSREVNRSWLWGNSPSAPESLSSLREVLALNQRLRVLVTHGFTDLVTPYMASEMQLDQLPATGNGSVGLKVYPGGHMYYSRDASRAQFAVDAGALLAAPQPPQSLAP